jgi:hypothetical protein
MKRSTVRAVTPLAWGLNLQHPMYATDLTYQLAAEWLKGCASVADWGGGTGYFGTWLPPTCAYRVVDGTLQTPDQALADLRSFREPSDGILLRHVLDVTEDWQEILYNALASFRERMAIVTFTPDAEKTHVHKYKSGWAVMHFSRDELRWMLGDLLVAEEAIVTTHPECIFYLERKR